MSSTTDEVTWRIDNWRINKIITLERATTLSKLMRAQKNTIVTLTGSFDILHAGHLDQLEEAKRQGHVLFVGLNSDKSVRDGKGLGRPFLSQEARAALLAALICTDYIVVLDEPYHSVSLVFIEAIKPHVHVNGPDYGPPETWIEWQTMQKVGAKGYMVERLNDFSTSSLVAKIRNQ